MNQKKKSRIKWVLPLTPTSSLTSTFLYAKPSVLNHNSDNQSTMAIKALNPDPILASYSMCPHTQLPNKTTYRSSVNSFVDPASEDHEDNNQHVNLNVSQVPKQENWIGNTLNNLLIDDYKPYVVKYTQTTRAKLQAKAKPVKTNLASKRYSIVERFIGHCKKVLSSF